MRRIRTLLAAAAVALPLALAGCAESPGTAATVGGTSFRQSTVTSMAATLDELFGAQGFDLTVLQWLITGEIYKQAEADSGVGLPTGLYDKVIEESLAADASAVALQDYPDVFTAYTDMLHWSIAATLSTMSADDLASVDAAYAVDTSEFDAATFLAAAAEVPVALNPRYGGWDSSQYTFSGVTSPLAAPLSSVTGQ
jgi:hypothetical protein